MRLGGSESNRLVRLIPLLKTAGLVAVYVFMIGSFAVAASVNNGKANAMSSKMFAEFRECFTDRLVRNRRCLPTQALPLA